LLTLHGCAPLLAVPAFNSLPGPVASPTDAGAEGWSWRSAARPILEPAMTEPERRGRRALADRIVDAALVLAEERGWENLRLHQVADQLGVPLAEVAAQYRDLDAVANAWFERARRHLVSLPSTQLDGRPPPERLARAVERWLDALAPHRRVTGEMLGEKLYASHPHHWVPMIFDLSRLIHWFLDVARIQSTGRQRQLAEIGTTLIFVATLRVWLADQSEGQARTRTFLERRLGTADRLLAWMRPPG
jgi:AcrR family transcriptional regulator